MPRAPSRSRTTWCAAASRTAKEWKWEAQRSRKLLERPASLARTASRVVNGSRTVAPAAGLSVMRYRPARVHRELVEVLMHSVETQQGVARRVVLESKLIVRESSVC